MNHISYIDYLRSNLCYILTAQKENKEKIKKLNEIIENIEHVPYLERLTSADLMLDEAHQAIVFFAEIGHAYNKEVSRLISILLEKTQTEI